MPSSSSPMKTISIASALCMLFLSVGCATDSSTQDRARNISFTGFLADYSKLRPGGEGHALLT